MIHIIEGVPGSGKSYYAVNYLITNFFEYDNFYDEYKEKENKNVLVITNIEDLKVKHLNLDVLIERFSVEKFFTVENFEKIQKQYRVKNIVLIIDECQRYFDRKFYNKDVFYLFQYHRHLGMDIFLITQSKNTISKEIVVLAEYIVRAVPRSLQVSTFRYKFYDVNGNLLFSRVLKKNKNIFRAYKSMNVEEVSKPKNVVLPKILFAVASFIFVFISIPLILKFFWLKNPQSGKLQEPGKVQEVGKLQEPGKVQEVGKFQEPGKVQEVGKFQEPGKVYAKLSLKHSKPKHIEINSMFVHRQSGKILQNSICSGNTCLVFSDEYLQKRSELYGVSDNQNNSGGQADRVGSVVPSRDGLPARNLVGR